MNYGNCFAGVGTVIAVAGYLTLWLICLIFMVRLLYRLHHHLLSSWIYLPFSGFAEFVQSQPQPVVVVIRRGFLFWRKTYYTFPHQGVRFYTLKTADLPSQMRVIAQW